jgi:mono/diheme cytochrome c family protein
MHLPMRYACALYAAIAAAMLPATAPAAEEAVSGGGDFQQRVAPFFQKHCFACHAGQEPLSGMALDRDFSPQGVQRNRKQWQTVLRVLRNNEMPPAERPRPPAEDVEHVAAWIEAELNSYNCEMGRDPGRVTLRRLNREEYNNTIRDLLGVDFRPGDDFPADDVGYGFDNIGDVLSLPPILMEKYFAAADAIVRRAIVAPEQQVPPSKQYSVEQTNGPGIAGGAFRGVYSRGEVWVEHEFPADGTYVARVEAYAQQAGDELARMEIKLGERSLATLDVKAEENEPAMHEVRFAAQAGKHRLGVWFVNDYYNPQAPRRNQRDRNLFVGTIRIDGPLGTQPSVLPETHRRIITCVPDERRSRAECARAILAPLVRRAFRRPVGADELERLVRLVELAERNGDSFERGIQLALQAVLVSPHFLFRVEQDPGPDDPDGIRLLSEHELAVRLSYFLWSSMPDEELFRHAEAGTLRRNLEAQVRRMLADPRSAALVRNFGGQWLQIRNLRTVTPDRRTFPTWNEQLRDDMERETLLFFEAVMREDRSIFEFIDARFTFLNERLAQHYGIDGVQGNQFRRVALSDPRRGGVLTQASILTITSNPERTSPVKRGKWILEQILGTPPPPPPANVEELAEDDEAQLSGSLRQRMEQHRAKPICASCHARMDPLGFAFENYDALGRWRDKDGRFPIDPSGELPDGRTFSGPAELKRILLSEDEKFRRTFCESMLTYALGRGLEYYDVCAVNDICAHVRQNQDRFSAVVTAIVHSDPFQKRRAKRSE